MNETFAPTFHPRRCRISSSLNGPRQKPVYCGMCAMFYQNNWETVGNMVTKAVLSVLNDGADPTPLNSTIITLIPKIKKARHMKDFRPISLCNVISKLITKVLVARFKNVLPHVISETQSAFLPNRLITDNILVAFELIHGIKLRTSGRQGVAAMKLDMSKAFDRVEWSFIKAVMFQMGFADGWISLIMNCLTKNHFTFLLNGELTGSVTPSRGLRQGCPLSPYLFLICSEGLSCLLKNEERLGFLQGYSLTRRAPPISHLLFADDSLLFCKATDSSCHAIKRSLDTYHKASGQVLNPEKSVLSFSPNTTLAAQVQFHRVLSMPIRDCHEKYLGLPAYTDRDKQQLFSEVKEKIWRLMRTWNDKLFSIGGKEILLKAVVQSIPTYIMSCFKLPTTICNQIESMMSNFWWGSNENGNKIHWRSWKLLCKNKSEGGMGFRSFVHYNQALLAKQSWRLLDNPSSLLCRLLKSRYFPHNSFLEAPHGHSPSLTWQGILHGRDLLKVGLRWKIGEGRNIRCATDPWIPNHHNFLPTYYHGPAEAVVSSLIIEDRQWDCNFFAADGIYNVHSGYHFAASLEETNLCSPSTSPTAWWKYFWDLQLPQKIKIFVWRVLHEALPVATSLVRRKIITDSTCSLCRLAWESIGHALFGCKYAKAVWRASNFHFDWNKATQMHKGDFLIHLTTLHSVTEMESIFCILWCIWSERNRVVHGQQAKPATHLASFANNYMSNYRSAQLKYRPQLHHVPPSSAPTQPVHIPWQPPPIGELKMNVDAAVDSSKNRIGLGAVIRNSTGQVIAALSMPIIGNFASHEMEAKAIFHSLVWASQWELQIGHVETDALMVTNALYGRTNSIAAFNDLIIDISCLLSFLPGVSISHVKRTANMAAHTLARYALGVDETCYWMESFPPSLYSVVVNDLPV
uniref:Reverse transcriptase domain-containing protein n=1 Tax=Cannabis sativa TaxID=3483 RepID=A0A803PZC5_CANSA